MKKSYKPDGMLLPSKFRELVKRLKDKEPELDAIIERDQGQDSIEDDQSKNEGDNQHGQED